MKGGINMIKEKSITVKGVNYIVSSDGKVYSSKNHREISQRVNADGYMQITVGPDSKRTQYRVHRMVADAFIPNPYGLPEVNHKDNNRANNCVENLEWCTHAYNVQYSINSGNHMSTTDVSGANNPNYGNHVLSDMYKNNPELAIENQSRPGDKNGRAIKIKVFDIIENKELVFGYIRAAATYLIENQLTTATKVDSVTSRLSLCAKTGKKYKNRFCVEFID